MKITLDDVAKEAGVSRATVDRVLNERGNVSPITVERVHRALYTTNYWLSDEDDTPKKIYDFDFIFPTPHTRYLDFYSRLIEAIKQSYNGQQVNARFHRVEAFNPNALAQKLQQIGTNTDGIAFAAYEHPTVRKAVDELVAKGVGVATLVSDISSTSRISYVGINNRAAGRTAGLLMGRFLGKQTNGKIGLFLGSHAYLGHEEREAGFRGLIREQFPNLRIVEMPELLDNDDRAQDLTASALQEESNLVGIYNVGGGTEGIAQTLKNLDLADKLIFIAHELFDNTKAHLLDGTIDVILNQDVKHEAFNAIEVLISHKEGRPLSSGTTEPQVEIYLAENI
ncbi:LacI family transcriptional regulator [Catenovulum agarivorans DS-2]|uniref:LacI family transcriptional regulator n=1 Tax=Catenovulum agarivorans DS-2 TaxID=1328313 RepID=W7QZC7_9ALTE|nr:LacI family DNA-binding transcriptional regulator [Catenovulum agarivorans]EWH10710.1 LacI family transcriptional regulator [Catenovulum agarivorans DS-2]